MRNFFSILFLSTLILTAIGQNDFECNCKGDFQKVFDFENEQGNKLLICGIIQDTLNNESMKITSISIYDCSNMDLVLTYDHDRIIPFTVTKFNDSIVFSNHHFVPMENNWKMTSIPFKEWTVKFAENKAEVSTGKIVFDYPDLSKKQSDSIQNICETLESCQEKVFYPLEYETLYILFIGALKDISNARWTFEHLRENFKFDVAAMETLNEIHYSVLVESINRDLHF